MSPIDDFVWQFVSIRKMHPIYQPHMDLVLVVYDNLTVFR